MKQIIVSFKNRNNLYAFVRLIRNSGVAVSIINTPHSISVSCGLSARLDFRYFSLIKTLLIQYGTADLIGVFLVERLNGYDRTERLL